MFKSETTCKGAWQTRGQVQQNSQVETQTWQRALTLGSGHPRADLVIEEQGGT